MVRRLSLLLATFLFFSPIGSPRAQEPAVYRILVTNDDGVRAPGILALATALRSLGEVTVVAPSENQSGKGHSISITDPIYADQVVLPNGLSALALSATPASCVKVGIKAVMTVRPDLVVSGINRGYNLGLVTYVSGTVGAAREAAMAGIPAIASSLAAGPDMDYGPAAQFTLKIAELVKSHGLASGVFLNVNVPPGPAVSIHGLQVTTQSAAQGEERFEERKTPSGRRYFWNVWREPQDEHEGTDVWATDHGYVAITPLRAGEFDRTTYEGWKAVIGRAR